MIRNSYNPISNLRRLKSNYISISIYNNNNNYEYVSSKQVKIMKQAVIGKSWWQWIKTQLKIGKYILAEGYRDSKSDISFYFRHLNLKFDKSIFNSKINEEDGNVQNSKQEQQSPQIKKRKYQIVKNLWKLPPIAILFCFPGGIPFILLYMAFLPALTPTWFLLDSYQQSLEKQVKCKQIEAFKYFIDCGSIKISQNREINNNENDKKATITTTINTEVFKKMSYGQKKKVQQLCYGYAFDGTNIIRKSFKLNLDYLFSQVVSAYLIEKDLFRKLEGQSFRNAQTYNDKLTQKVLQQAQLLYLSNQNAKTITGSSSGTLKINKQ